MDKPHPELETERLHGSSSGHGRIVVRVPARFLDRHFTGSVQALQLVAIALILSCCCSPVLSKVITRDVCVIGGGGSGTYAAIRLRDFGKSVVVVERNNRLGGHTETYTDPATNAHIDYGVVLLYNLSIVRDYFGRFDIPLAAVDVNASYGLPQKYVDFRTGLDVANYIPSDPTAALATYAAQLSKYPFLQAGFDLEYPVPEDLLLPFGDFVTKYALEPAVQTIFGYGQGIGDLLRTPTIYVFKLFNNYTLTDIQTGFLISAGAGNSELYEKALLSLDADVLLRSRVVSTKRNAAHGYAVIKVATPSGLKTIHAKQIVISIPPTLDNLQGFDLSANEQSLFGQFRNAGYYTALLRNTGIPDNVSVTNVGADTAYNLPALPGVYGFTTTIVPGLRDVKFGSTGTLSDLEVKTDIVDALLQLRSAGLQTTIPEFAAYEGHIPFELTVPADAIRNGFYKNLTALQGCHRTWYTGAAFHTHNSPLLWIFTEALVNRMVLA